MTRPVFNGSLLPALTDVKALLVALDAVDGAHVVDLKDAGRRGGEGSLVVVVVDKQTGASPRHVISIHLRLAQKVWLFQSGNSGNLSQAENDEASVAI